MRAPFSEMLPIRLGLSILTRGVAAIAASRLTMAAAPPPAVLAGALAEGAAPGVVEPGVVCGVGLVSSAWVWVCARCFSICGTL